MKRDIRVWLISQSVFAHLAVLIYEAIYDQ